MSLYSGKKHVNNKDAAILDLLCVLRAMNDKLISDSKNSSSDLSFSSENDPFKKLYSTERTPLSVSNKWN